MRNSECGACRARPPDEPKPSPSERVPRQRRERPLTSRLPCSAVRPCRARPPGRAKALSFGEGAASAAGEALTSRLPCSAVPPCRARPPDGPPMTHFLRWFRRSADRNCGTAGRPCPTGRVAPVLLFHGAVDDCEETGIEPEKAYRGSFNVRISPELHKQAAVAAAAQNISLNRFVENSVQTAVRARA